MTLKMHGENLKLIQICLRC